MLWNSGGLTPHISMQQGKKQAGSQITNSDFVGICAADALASTVSEKRWEGVAPLQGAGWSLRAVLQLDTKSSSQ